MSALILACSDCRGLLLVLLVCLLIIAVLGSFNEPPSSPGGGALVGLERPIGPARPHTRDEPNPNLGVKQ